MIPAVPPEMKRLAPLISLGSSTLSTYFAKTRFCIAMHQALRHEEQRNMNRALVAVKLYGTLWEDLDDVQAVASPKCH